MDERDAQIFIMSINRDDLLLEFSENVKFDYNLKKKNWFNIGGNTKFILRQKI